MRETGLFTDFLWNPLFHILHLNNLFRRGNVPSISTLCKICDAFRISLSEFFSGNNDALSSLNPEQQNLIGCWNLLSKEDKNLVKTYIAGLLKKLPE